MRKFLPLLDEILFFLFAFGGKIDRQEFHLLLHRFEA